MSAAGTGLFVQFLLLFLSLLEGNGFRRISLHYRHIYHHTSSCVLKCTPSADLIVSDMIEFLQYESISSLVPKEQCIVCVNSIQSNDEFWTETEGRFNELWNEYDTRIRKEDRKFSEIIGENATSRLLENIQKVDIYDPESVQAFLQSQAIEQMIGGILYEGIFEFIQRVDFIGSVVNNIPIIGPIRQQIVSEFKKNLDRILGSQVKVFLGSFNRIAVQRMITFVLSQDNRESLAKANRNLVSSILQRPINSLLPSISTSEKLRAEIWVSFRNMSEEDARKLVDTIYDYVGDKRIGEVVEFKKIVKAAPATNAIAVNAVNRFLEFQSKKKSTLS